jgi:negative regulator of sigma E activity
VALSMKALTLACSMLVCGVLGNPADSTSPSADEILAKVQLETNRRHVELTEYSGSRQYTLQNGRFGAQARTAVLMRHRLVDGDRFIVVTRSGSGQLSGIIDKLLSSEAGASLPPEQARHEINSANYRVQLLGREVAAGRTCYVLALSPRMKTQFLVVGRVWVDAESYGVVRMEGQFAASVSVLVGAPHIAEDYVDVRGFWLPGHVRSVTSSILLGPTELDIQFSNYQVDRDLAPRP